MIPPKPKSKKKAASKPPTRRAGSRRTTRRSAAHQAEEAQEEEGEQEEYVPWKLVIPDMNDSDRRMAHFHTSICLNANASEHFPHKFQHSSHVSEPLFYDLLVN